MQCTLTPLSSGAAPLHVAGEAPLTLGRGRDCDIKIQHCAKVSRHHATLQLSATTCTLHLTAIKPVCIQRGGGGIDDAGTSAAERVESDAELQDGDIIYLLTNRGCGYKVAITGGDAAAGNENTNKRKAAAKGVFAGLHLAFWHSEHAKVMKAKAEDEGATIEADAGSETTHCVAPNLTPAQAAARFARCPPARYCVEVTLQGNCLTLPVGVHFVTPSWVSDSLLRGSVQDEDAAKYVPVWYSQALMQMQRDAEQQAAAARADSAVTLALTPGAPQAAAEHDSSTAGMAHLEQKVQEGQPEVEEEDGAGSEPCVVTRQGGEWVAVRGRRPRFTGGQTGLPWGFAGVWDEPYDVAAAGATVERLRRSWYAAPEDQGPPGTPVAAAAGANGMCAHAACGRLAYCIVAKLEEVKAAYTPGERAATFKIKAIDKAKQLVASHPGPLVSASDVDAVAGLGGTSADKVKEIVVQGCTLRMQILAGDERHRCLQEFTRVWGVGAATAKAWFAAGCRSLADVAARGEELRLTAQQRCGLAHVDDFERRIPRSEIAAVEQMLRDRIFSLLERDMRAGDVELTYCRVTGSFARGEPDSSDIDLLTCLPPSLAHADCSAVLHRLLAGLLTEGFLTRDIDPAERAPEAAGHSATWLGACRPAGSPCARRIDIKIYPPALAPYAAAYFCNSHDFVRALRLHANKDAGDARRHNPVATGFKLSDKELTPIVKEVGKPEVVLGPAVPCRCESDIFRELGLAFVPAAMRKFTT